MRKCLEPVLFVTGELKQVLGISLFHAHTMKDVLVGRKSHSMDVSEIHVSGGDVWRERHRAAKGHREF